MPLSGICRGGQPLISNNYGSKKVDRVEEAFICQFDVCVTNKIVFWAAVMISFNFFAGFFFPEALKIHMGNAN